MPRIRLKNIQITEVMNYMANASGNKKEGILTAVYVVNTLKD
jgi:hypothetical protein